MKKYFYLILLGAMVLVSKASAQETAKQDTVQGYQFYQVQNYTEAEKLLQAAIKLDPAYEPAYQVLGGVYIAEGRKAEAMAEYQQALTLQPNNPSLKAYVDSQQPTAPALPAASERQPAWGRTPANSAPASTQPMSDEELDKPHFIMGAFGGLAFGADGFNSDTFVSWGTGSGGGLYAGAAFDRHFSVALKLGLYSFPYTYPSYYYYGTNPSTVGYSLQDLEIMTSCKYVFMDRGVRPYVTIGMGTGIFYDSGSADASTEPLFEGGLGVTIPLSPRWDLFAEIDYDLILDIQYGYDDNISYIPMSVGIQFDAR